MDANSIVFNAVSITGDVCYDSTIFPAVIAAIAKGKLDLRNLENLITARIELEELEEYGIRALIENKDKHIKILVKISGQH